MTSSYSVPTMKNRVLIILSVLSFYIVNEAYAGVSREQMEKMADGFRKTCVGKVGVDLSLISGIRDGKFIEDPAAKCYTKCIMGLMRTITKQGAIDIDMLIKQINIMASPDIAESMISGATKCNAETIADDPCELAWGFTKCLYAADPSVYFFP